MVKTKENPPEYLGTFEDFYIVIQIIQGVVLVGFSERELEARMNLKVFEYPYFLDINLFLSLLNIKVKESGEWLI